jgi:endonuclease/exonuclease/phosphatase (EEP) superfamily protein YafD
MPALLGAPIDHVMASSDWHATGSIVLRSMATSDSDHRPLIVQLEPAG